ncbi:MAG: hypothetical protein ABFC67_08325 [Mizugakiibacter sp.]|uniref:hypothetical protein n=1 Tax=Mizugakiibacter sp. TaxID=1972610 RepID=UPI0031C3626D|nr:hypothetical protein [Xanthomonadaceae bacterium]
MPYRILAAVLALTGAASASAADAVVVPKPVPYAEDSDIAGNIKRECDLGNTLADYIREYADKHHVEVRFAPDAKPEAPGRVLAVEIRDAVSSGNAFLGHHKSTSVHGKLYQDGKLIGSFKDRRDSMGGAFAGFKGSCSVLGRTVKAIGEDVGAWLAQPTMDAELGDLG